MHDHGKAGARVRKPSNGHGADLIVYKPVGTVMVAPSACTQSLRSLIGVNYIIMMPACPCAWTHPSADCMGSPAYIFQARLSIKLHVIKCHTGAGCIHPLICTKGKMQDRGMASWFVSVYNQSIFSHTPFLCGAFQGDRATHA